MKFNLRNSLYLIALLMRELGMTCSFMLTPLSCSVKSAFLSSVLQLHFDSFSNPRSLLDNGLYCDGVRSAWKTSDCDTKFSILVQADGQYFINNSFSLFSCTLFSHSLSPQKFLKLTSIYFFLSRNLLLLW